MRMSLLEIRTQIKIFGGISEVFTVNSGLKKGDDMASVLLNLIMDWIIKAKNLDSNSILIYKKCTNSWVCR